MSAPGPAVVVQADGGARGNPGRAGSGAVVIDPSTNALLHYGYEALRYATNNVAEYTALVLGLRLAKEYGATAVAVEMDSKLVVQQMLGRWRVKHPDLQELHEAARRASSEFASVRYKWIRRELNTRADWLANLAMDGRPLEAPPAPAGELTVLRTEPTVPSSKHVTRAKGRGVPNTDRLREVAALAVELGLTGSANELAKELRRRAPRELTAIYDNLPGELWLTNAIAAAPLTWRDAHGSATNSREAA